MSQQQQQQPFDLDLDIRNYSIKDLETFFQLRGDYTAKDVESKEYKIREQLLSSGHIDKRFKRDLIEFLETGKRWILVAKFEKKEPTTLANKSTYVLDPFPNTPASKTDTNSRARNVVERPVTQFIHTKQEEYLQGVLNPLETRVITKCLNIDTRFRENMYKTSCSDFTLNLPTKINKVVEMQLASIEMPITFYGISKSYGNHYFYVILTQTIDSVATQTSKQILIKDGNYNAADLIEQVNQVLQQDADIFAAIEFLLDITSTGSGTGKATMQIVQTAPNAATISAVVLDFSRDMNGNEQINHNIISSADLSTKIGWNLGFTKPLYEGALTYTADTIIEPASIRYLFLAIDDYQNSANNHFISAFENSTLNPNILARITIKGTYFSLVMENDLSIVSEPRKYFGPVDIQRLRIRLFDEHGRIVDMNGANFSFCLNFKLMYDL
jgi:hypothetical protein